MGLDMYLKKKIDVKNWNFRDKEFHNTISIKREGKEREDFDVKKICKIELDVFYWRKSNHIHQWFIDNVQEGEDDCKNYYVEIVELKALQTIIEKVLADHSLAKELLPTQEGCFFGSTDYNEWYYKDLEETLVMLKTIEDEEDMYTSYYYESSW